MVSIIMNLDDELKARINRFSWINWSEVAREESRKKRIFEEYLKTRKLPEEDSEFCELIDWHPVDELPLREDFVAELNKARTQKSIKLKSLGELFK
jgi:hypothetical protein